MKYIHSIQLKNIIIAAILIFSVSIMCGCSDMMAEIGKGSVQGALPYGITGLSASPGNEEITLTWTDPADPSPDHIEVTWTPDSAGTQTVAIGTESYTATGLYNGTEYTFTVHAFDAGGTVLDGQAITAKPGKIGAPANAVYVYDADGINNIRNDLDGYYVLMRDVNLYQSGYTVWTPIGYIDSSIQFTGTLDGNGHTISGITAINESHDTQGLFRRIGTAGTVQNLTVEGSVTGYYCVGGLTGVNSGAITGCRSSVTVNGDNYAGGLVGVNNGTITSSYATGAVSGIIQVGGLAGHSYYGTITACYASGTVTGTSEVGGLVGYNYYGTITACYASGTVIGAAEYGGLVGGYNPGTINACYFTGINNGYAIYIPAGDIDWRTESTFDSTYWDFTNTWAIDTNSNVNNGYPYLRENMP